MRKILQRIKDIEDEVEKLTSKKKINIILVEEDKNGNLIDATTGKAPVLSEKVPNVQVNRGYIQGGKGFIPDENLVVKVVEDKDAINAMKKKNPAGRVFAG